MPWLYVPTRQAVWPKTSCQSSLGPLAPTENVYGSWRTTMHKPMLVKRSQKICHNWQGQGSILTTSLLIRQTWIRLCHLNYVTSSMPPSPQSTAVFLGLWINSTTPQNNWAMNRWPDTSVLFVGANILGNPEYFSAPGILFLEERCWPSEVGWVNDLVRRF